MTGIDSIAVDCGAADGACESLSGGGVVDSGALDDDVMKVVDEVGSDVGSPVASEPLGAADDTALIVGAFVVAASSLAIGTSPDWYNPIPQSIVFSSSSNSKHAVLPVASIVESNTIVSPVAALLKMPLN